MATDPWEEEAKQFKAAPQAQGTPATTSAPNEDWKVWQQGGGTSQPQQQGIIKQAQGLFDQAVTPKLHSADQGILGNAGTAGLNVGKGVLSLATPAVHPLQSIGATGFKGAANPWEANKRDPLALLQGYEGPDPLTSMAQGVKEHPLESLEQFGGQMLGGKLTGMAGEGIANLRDPVRPYRSPLIPENEAIARAATDVIKPNPLEYNRTVQNLTSQMPQAKEFLQRSGINKPASPLEFGKGSTGAGKEASGFLQENLIKPNAEAPAGGGTVNSVYSRLSDINDKLRPIYRARSMGEQMTKEAQDNMANLEAERDKLNGVLYKTLSQRSGLPEEQIQNINQRGAQLQSVGDITDAAQAVRRMGLTHSPGGMLVPMGNMERVLRFLDYARGGPEAVAGKKLGRIMGQVNESPTPLPNPEDIANHRLNFLSQERDAAAANRATRGTRLRNPQ